MYFIAALIGSIFFYSASSYAVTCEGLVKTEYTEAFSSRDFEINNVSVSFSEQSSSDELDVLMVIDGIPLEFKRVSVSGGKTLKIEAQNTNEKLVINLTQIERLGTSYLELVGSTSNSFGKVSDSTGLLKCK